jgi:hypothetical protein
MYGTLDTEIAILCRINGGALAKAAADHILYIEIGEISSYTSLRGDGSDYIKSNPSRPMDNVAPPKTKRIFRQRSKTNISREKTITKGSRF